MHLNFVSGTSHISFLKEKWDRDVCGYASEADTRAKTGRNPVGLKWIDTNKGSGEAARYRSRLACTEVRNKRVEPVLSATPLEALRVLLSVGCTELWMLPDGGESIMHGSWRRDEAWHLRDISSKRTCAGPHPGTR